MTTVYILQIIHMHNDAIWPSFINCKLKYQYQRKQGICSSEADVNGSGRRPMAHD